MLTQGDFCPHCGLIIMMPTDLDPNCLGCGNQINDDEEEEEEEEEEE